VEAENARHENAKHLRVVSYTMAL